MFPHDVSNFVKHRKPGGAEEQFIGEQTLIIQGFGPRARQIVWPRGGVSIRLAVNRPSH